MKRRPIVLREWSADEAIAAQKKFQRDGGDGADPIAPLFQWFALNELERLRKRFEAGSKHSLMIALRICAAHDLPMPEWVARAYIAAFDSLNNYRIKSWDDVFGQIVPKGQHLAALRKAQLGRVAVFNRMHEAKQRGEAITKELYERIGKELGLGIGLVERYYSDTKELAERYRLDPKEFVEKLHRMSKRSTKK